MNTYLTNNIAKSKSILKLIERYTFVFRRELLSNIIDGRHFSDGQTIKTRDDTINRLVSIGFEYYYGDFVFKSTLNERPPTGVTHYKASLFDGGTLYFWYYVKNKRNCYCTFFGKLMECFWIEFRKFFENSFVRYSGTEKVPRTVSESTVRWFTNMVYENAVYSLQEFMSLELKIDLRLIQFIAAMNYEKRSNTDVGIIFARNINNLLFEQNTAHIRQFCNVPFNLENAREIRKILEMSKVNRSDASQWNHLLIVDIENRTCIKGICSFESKYSESLLHKCYWVHISQGGKWELSYGAQKICCCKNGMYQAFIQTTEEIINDFKNQFTIPRKIHDIILEAEKVCSHGAILICFCKNGYAKEIKRLTRKKHGYNLYKKVNLSETSIIRLFTSMDGAIFLDNKGNACAVGVILDGMAINDGIMARGSRFNSSQDYLDNLNRDDVFAVVISEDGGIDIIKKRN